MIHLNFFLLFLLGVNYAIQLICKTWFTICPGRWIHVIYSTPIALFMLSASTISFPEKSALEIKLQNNQSLLFQAMTNFQKCYKHYSADPDFTRSSGLTNIN